MSPCIQERATTGTLANGLLQRLLGLLIEQAGSDLHIRTNRSPYLRIHGQLTREFIGEVVRPDVVYALVELLVRMRSNAAHHLASVEAELVNGRQNSSGNHSSISTAWDLIIDKFWKHLQEFGVVNFSAGTDEWEESLVLPTRLRVCCFLDADGVSVVVRRLSDTIPNLIELGFNEEAVQRIRKAYSRACGLILVTGPTGSGKTTTLGSIIHEINITRSQHIVTIEDPIEIRHKQFSPLVPGSEIYRCLVTQREVFIHCNSFREGLNDALRQDPNIIMVGEMRTRDTLEAALVAAETGHLVLSTLHTNGGYQTISRIISEFEKERHEFITRQLAMNLICVVSQRLLPQIKEAGRTLCYEILEVQGAVKSALMSGVPERIPNAMTPQNSIKWNEHLRWLLGKGEISPETFEINRMNEQD